MSRQEIAERLRLLASLRQLSAFAVEHDIPLRTLMRVKDNPESARKGTIQWIARHLT